MSNEEKKSIISRVMDDIKADASAQHEIDKANFAAVKADSKARFDAAATPSEDFIEFKEANGLKEKAAVVGKHLARDGKERREQGRENYEEMLRNQRAQINDLTQISLERSK